MDQKQYLDAHGVQQKLQEAIQWVLRTRPADPRSAIGNYLLEQRSTEQGAVRVVSWNMAAINNNPFEYWLTHPDKDYAVLMESIESFVSDPGERDVSVKTVFTPAMYAQLEEHMTAQGWDGAEACAAAWEELRERPIVSGFLKDKGLGDKRLMSMPDRVTNTIDVEGGGRVCRPTVISSFSGDMATVDAWWPLWLSFHFSERLTLPGKKGGASSSKLPCELITKIPRAKYPALTEEEEAMSMRLQTLCIGIFDAILVHMVATLSPDGKWLVLKKQILEALTWAKEPKQIAILQGMYADADVFCLQEVRTASMREVLPTSLGNKYTVVCPAKPSKADQNSVVLLSKSRFDPASVVDLTSEALELYPEDATKVTDGDLLLISALEVASGTTMLFASFHGDTDGLATAPVLTAVHAVAQRLGPSVPLVFGLDANTYAKAKPGKQAPYLDFVADFTAKGYACNFPADAPLDARLTTSNARTFLQPQLQKACKASAKAVLGDFNPKDYILFPKAAFTLVNAGRDNSGKRTYDADMVVPTLDWPSDHGLVYATLQPQAPVDLS